MWSQSESQAVVQLLELLADRYEIEECLARCWVMRSAERVDGVEYSAPGVGAWVRVRYRDDQLVAAVVVGGTP